MLVPFDHGVDLEGPEPDPMDGLYDTYERLQRLMPGVRSFLRSVVPGTGNASVRGLLVQTIAVRTGVCGVSDTVSPGAAQRIRAQLDYGLDTLAESGLNVEALTLEALLRCDIGALRVLTSLIKDASNLDPTLLPADVAVPPVGVLIYLGRLLELGIAGIEISDSGSLTVVRMH